MNKLESFLEKFLLPIAAKMEQNPQLTAIRRAMMTLVPVTLVGSIPTLFAQLSGLESLPGPVVSALGFMASVTGPMSTPTMGFLAIYVALFIGYYYAEQRDVWNIGAMVAAVSAFVMCATLTSPEGAIDISYYGGTGIFTAIIASLLAVEILHIFRNKLGFTINLGEGVPTPILKSFENLWPIMFSVVIIAFGKYGLESLTGTPIVKLIETLFSPLTGSVNTLPGILFLLFLIQLLWWFGIHGYAVIAGPIIMPVAFANVDINAAIAAGTQTGEYMIVTPDFIWNLAAVTGSGLTGAICILMVMSKSKRFKTIGKLSIVPSFFGIGETIIFGLPVMLNPVMLIPWLLSSPLAAIIGWFAISTEFMNPFILVSPYIPIPFGALVACLDWKYLIVFAAIMVAVIALYLPFFKVLEAQAIKSESGEKDRQSIDDMDFDDIF